MALAVSENLDPQMQRLLRRLAAQPDYCESFSPADEFEHKIDSAAVDRAVELELVAVIDDALMGNSIHIHLTRKGRRTLDLPPSFYSDGFWWPAIDFVRTTAHACLRRVRAR